VNAGRRSRASGVFHHVVTEAHTAAGDLDTDLAGRKVKEREKKGKGGSKRCYKKEDEGRVAGRKKQKRPYWLVI
jgi:hypothetical protein